MSYRVPRSMMLHNRSFMASKTNLRWRIRQCRERIERGRPWRWNSMRLGCSSNRRTTLSRRSRDKLIDLSKKWNKCAKRCKRRRSLYKIKWHKCEQRCNWRSKSAKGLSCDSKTTRWPWLNAKTKLAASNTLWPRRTTKSARPELTWIRSAKRETY